MRFVAQGEEAGECIATCHPKLVTTYDDPLELPQVVSVARTSSNFSLRASVDVRYFPSAGKIAKSRYNVRCLASYNEFLALGKILDHVCTSNYVVV